MNKWQLICPAIAALIFALVAGFLHARLHSRAEYPFTASLVGADLIAKTNSNRLTTIGQTLRTNLETFLATHPVVAGVRPDSTGSTNPVVVLSLVNDARERFDIYLRWEAKLHKFTPISYCYPAPWPPTNWPDATGH